MRKHTDAIRDHLVRALDWEEAHAGFDNAVDGIPAATYGVRPAGFEHSPWELLEHVRLAQEDILDFCVNEHYVHAMKWPDDYWPKQQGPASAAAWDASVEGFRQSLGRMQALVRDVEDLTAKVPTGKSTQTYLRAVLLAIDHTAYHVGQLVAVRQALGAWHS